MSQVLRERAINMLTAGISTRAVARELNANFSTISRLQSNFRELGSTANRPHNRRPFAWRRVGEQFADLNIVNRVPHGGSGVIVWACISYRQRTQLHFIVPNCRTSNEEKYREWGKFLKTKQNRPKSAWNLL
jgi:hypothetical protein